MNSQIDRPYIRWQAHFTNGGTGITKFGGATDFWHHEPIVRLAVELWAAPSIWIVENNPPELHASLCDLGDFWVIANGITLIDGDGEQYLMP
jgi:hypothetical protein